MLKKYIRIDIDQGANLAITGWDQPGFANFNAEDRLHEYRRVYGDRTFWIFADHVLNDMQQMFFVRAALEGENWVDVDLGRQS